ncbi:HECT-like ubiquitin-conjugating enzyme (E2)-binding domain-containing protein [Hirsutella rhossiliensis]|uniref:HECT-like ubiquitin-conjugating enzyme (E2)-binding domain-containing protein n=1 Tax=Hirsutella rhossiliensis TaxID=111463 RepID=A0A9P8N5Z1_9HYPO|nr:HECT-like ubiquitin-conjugating enzyme (E2)-binding domain-containing protein [Hirsutella rhossiliensis]KAH0967207.1 HECT-like ubiquitin-conjugating enzyme (E2)-binding domain-containing protein [Hirsutella rhossiliensis]
MAAPKSATGISIYAELLPNIRQVSVGAALPSPSDATTSAEVVDEGRRLRISHQGCYEVVDLPATVTTSAAPAVPKAAGSELGWRLPVSTAEAGALRSAPESQAVPWSSVDLKAGSPISCRGCGSGFVQRGQVKAWQDLPSENWAEMMEFWHCHKPHDHSSPEDEGLANRGYGANSTITARPGIGFVDITLFMLSESDCNNLLFSSSSSGASFSTSAQAMEDELSTKYVHVLCRGCSAEVGLYSQSALSVTLFKWQVSCKTIAPSRNPSAPECLASTLLTAISRSGYAKSVVAPHASDGLDVPARALHLWVLNSNVVYTCSALQGKTAAMKILYRDISVDEGNKLVDSVTSDVQEINLPTSVVEAAREALKSSTILIPERERSLKGWSAGLLQRWSLEI